MFHERVVLRLKRRFSHSYFLFSTGFFLKNSANTNPTKTWNMSFPRNLLGQLEIGTKASPYRNTTNKESAVNWNCFWKNSFEKQKETKTYTNPLAPMCHAGLAKAKYPIPLIWHQRKVFSIEWPDKSKNTAVVSTKRGMELLNKCSRLPWTKGPNKIPFKPTPVLG